VLGPTGKEDKTRSLIVDEPMIEWVDLSFGAVLHFRVADACGSAALSFVFVTGYDMMIL
jgi:hypothetical protein